MGETVLGNRYEIIRKVGDGGMAFVYEAKDRLLNRTVAVKVLRPEFVDDEEFLGKFKRYVANVGDSRCYLLKDNKFNQISIDHSVVQELIEANIITKEEAKSHPRRNHITRAMGTDELVIVDIFKHKINTGDKILLATDGLVGFVDDEIIKDIIIKNEEISVLTKNLIDVANEVSGKDNVSVILIEDK